jgi:uncharacterized protein YjbI with pentapeptide repeats
MLGIFTVVITFDQRKEARIQRAEDQRAADEKRELDKNISALQRENDREMAQQKRDADDLNAAIQRNMSKEQRDFEMKVEKERYEQERAKFLDGLLLNYINDIGILLKENNGSLTNNVVIHALARAKTLNTISQLDPRRNARLVEFLYEARQLSGEMPLDLSGAQMNDIDLSDSVRFTPMNGLNLANTFLHNASFAGQNWIDIDFTGAKMNNATFVSCSMNNWIFTGASMVKANFSLATLVNTDFSRADLTKAIFSNISVGHMLTFEKTRLTGAIFIGSNFKTGSNVFTDSNLVDTIWWQAKVAATFEYCNLANVDMTDAEILYVKFTGSRLENATLVNTSMQGTSFDFSYLANANMRNARSLDARKLAKVISIHDAILPNGSRGQDVPLLRNGDAQCNRAIQEAWTVEEGQIEVVDHPNEPNNCVFILAANATVAARMSQVVDLTNYADLIQASRGKYLINIRRSNMMADGDTTFVQQVKDSAQLPTNHYNYGKFIKFDYRAIQLRIIIEFRFDKNRPTNDTKFLPWCDSITLNIESHIDEWYGIY